VGDEDPEIAELAAQALLEWSEAVSPIVSDALSGENERLWRAALGYLRAAPKDTHWAQVPDKMWRDLLKASDRRNVVMALADLSGDWAIRRLFLIAGDENTEIAGLAAQSLLSCLRTFPTNPLWGQIPNIKDWNNLLEPADYHNVIPALDALGGDIAISNLFYIAGDENAEIAQSAVRTLIKWSKDVTHLVANSLRNEDKRFWRAAIRFLGTQPDHPLWTDMPLKILHEVLTQPMVWVPPGSFVMGSDKNRDPLANDNEIPQHEIALPGYWIGRYPVTVAHWRDFIQSSGFKCEEKSLGNLDNCPVTDVSWDDAMTYCHWLSEKTGLHVTLPSEAEWEKSARGTDGRVYPWGNEFNGSNCNSQESSVGEKTEVKKYDPQGNSLYGCADMAGNIWEWTRSLFQPKYPYKFDNECEDIKSTEKRITLRGGSYVNSAEFVRCAMRMENGSSDRDNIIGFRVVVFPSRIRNNKVSKYKA
jgi:formylglycine-generating enzyme required for sulfatase activity